MGEKERREAMVGVVQPHKINVVLMSFHFSVWVDQVRKMNRHVHFFDKCLKESILQYGGKEAGSL